jgi:hypothetical protein
MGGREAKKKIIHKKRKRKQFTKSEKENNSQKHYKPFMKNQLFGFILIIVLFFYK